MTRNLKDLPGPVLALATLGALGISFGLFVAYWWVAHQMAWWTFGLLTVGCSVFWEVVKQTVKTVRNK